MNWNGGEMVKIKADDDRLPKISRQHHETLVRDAHAERLKMLKPFCIAVWKTTLKDVSLFLSLSAAVDIGKPGR